MKRIILLIATTLLISCGGTQSKKSGTTAQSEPHDDGVEVLYFHGKQRCITCNAIEALTREVVDQTFATQLAQGEVSISIIDISTPEGEKIADEYGVTWSSIFINQWKDGVETRNDLTQFGFAKAKNSPDEFKSGVTDKIKELLK